MLFTVVPPRGEDCCEHLYPQQQQQGGEEDQGDGAARDRRGALPERTIPVCRGQRGDPVSITSPYLPPLLTRILRNLHQGNSKIKFTPDFSFACKTPLQHV